MRTENRLNTWDELTFPPLVGRVQVGEQNSLAHLLFPSLPALSPKRGGRGAGSPYVQPLNITKDIFII
jgi:hypothetical protein